MKREHLTWGRGEGWVEVALKRHCGQGLARLSNWLAVRDAREREVGDG